MYTFEMPPPDRNTHLCHSVQAHLAGRDQGPSQRYQGAGVKKKMSGNGETHLPRKHLCFHKNATAEKSNCFAFRLIFH